MCYEDSTDSQGVMSPLQAASRVYVAGGSPGELVPNTHSLLQHLRAIVHGTAVSQAKLSCATCSSICKSQQVTLTLTTVQQPFFLHTNKPQFSWINSPADWNLARFSLTGTRKSPLFPPMFIKHFFLSLQRKYHFLIASFKLSLCSSGGNSAPFCSLTSKTLLRIFSTPPPQSQVEENKWESFLSYLSMIRLCSAQRQQVSEVVKLATSLTSSANSKAFWITLQFDLKKFDAMSNKIK